MIRLLGQFTSQFFFDDGIPDQVMAQAPYNMRRTSDTRAADGYAECAEGHEVGEDCEVVSGTVTRIQRRLRCAA